MHIYNIQTQIGTLNLAIKQSKVDLYFPRKAKKYCDPHFHFFLTQIAPYFFLEGGHFGKSGGGILVIFPLLKLKIFGKRSILGEIPSKNYFFGNSILLGKKVKKMLDIIGAFS